MFRKIKNIQTAKCMNIYKYICMYIYAIKLKLKLLYKHLLQNKRKANYMNKGRFCNAIASVALARTSIQSD